MMHLHPDLAMQVARERQRELIAEADARWLAASVRPKRAAAARPSRPRVRLQLGRALLLGWGQRTAPR